MSGFTVTIGLKDCAIDSEGHARLDELMELEGFKRRNRTLAGRIHPANLSTHPENLPHATYFGWYNQDASALQRHLLGRIPSELHPEMAIFPQSVEGQ
jgi:hypothetical protein